MRLKLQMFADQAELFVDGRTSVLIAVDGVAEEGQRAELIDHRANTGVHHHRTFGRIVGGAALGDVSGCQVAVAADGFLGFVGLFLLFLCPRLFRWFLVAAIYDSFTSLRVFVLAGEQQMWGIVMHLLQRHVELAGRVQREMSQDGMTFLEESIEGTSEPIVVEFFWRDVPQDVRARVLGPLAHVAEGDGRVQPRGHQQAQDGAVVVLGLRISRTMLVNDLDHVHTLDERKDDGQRAKATRFRFRLVSVPSERCHLRKMANSRKTR